MGRFSAVHAVPTARRSESSFVDAVRRAVDEPPRSAVVLARETPTLELPAVRIQARARHVRVANVEPALLAAARLVTSDERRVLDALSATSDTRVLADDVGLGIGTTERLLAGLVRRGLVSLAAP